MLARPAPRRVRLGRLTRLRRQVRDVTATLALEAARLLPPRLVIWLGTGLGAVAAFALARHRIAALESIGLALPHLGARARTQVAHGCFRHLGKALGEAIAYRPQAARPQVRWAANHQAILERALARGRGALLVSGHVGNWELLLAQIAQSGFRVTFVARRSWGERFTKAIARARGRAGITVAWRGEPGTVCAMLRALRRNEVLALLIDQDIAAPSVWVPFFGQLAKTPRAPAALALRSGATPLVAFAIRDDADAYCLTIREVDVPPPHEAEVAGVADDRRMRELTATFSREIESEIRNHPEQWVWMHRRWKTRP